MRRLIFNKWIEQINIKNQNVCAAFVYENILLADCIFFI